MAELIAAEKINNVALDFDDSIICTKEIFRQRMDEIYRTLAEVLVGVAIKEEIEALNNEAYAKHFVNPKRWDVVLGQFQTRHPEVPDPMIADCLRVLGKIYTTVPALKYGAIETLATLVDRGYSLGLVTHAYTDWTDFKLRETGLRQFFPDGKVAICDMDGPKGVEEWSKALSALGFDTGQTAVVGDSVRSDILPAYGAGIRQLYWIREPDAWSVQLGNPPNGTTQLGGIHELTKFLL